MGKKHKKEKKHEKILKELKSRKKRNEKYCELNSCSPTPYMVGANTLIDDMILFIENL